MSILEDVVQAAEDIQDKRDQIVADADALRSLVQGAPSGPSSTVDLGGAAGTVKSPARVMTELQDALHSTSVSNVTIGTGTKVFATQSGKSYAIGAWVFIPSDADPSNYVFGQVSDYAGTTLEVDVQKVGGAGTFNAWSIYLSGPAGAGDKGWSPILAIVTDAVNLDGDGNSRRVHRIVDWVGGEGTKPATGDYLGPAGPVSDIASAVNIRGAAGAPGSGSGDVTAASNFGADNRMVKTDGTDKGVQVTGITVSDNDDVSGVRNFASTGSFALGGDIAPSQITSNQNDYNPANLATAFRLQLTSDAARTITGIQGGADGRILLLENLGSNPITLADASGSSTAANRFAFGADVIVDPNKTALLAYDAVNSRWRLAAQCIDFAKTLARSIWGPYTDIASGSTCDIGALTTSLVNVTGTTTITSFGTVANWLRIVKFAGVLQITRNATTLETPSQANITTAAGDVAIVISDGSGNVRIVGYFRVDGRALVGPNDIPQNLSLSGVISPSQITSNQNDYGPSGINTAFILRLNSDAARDITGLAAPTSGRAETKILINVGSFAITLRDQSASSSASNRFAIGEDIAIAVGKCMWVWYDTGSSRWRPLSDVRDFGALALLDAITDIPGAITVSGVVSPSQITSNQNDYNPASLAAASSLRLSTDASRSITGIQAGAAGREITLFNIGSNNIVLKNADSGSTAGNRFDFGGDRTLAAGDGLTIWYDTTSSRWRAKAVIATGGAGGGTTFYGACDGRLSLSTGVFEMGAAVSAATSIYFVPAAVGGQIGLYDGSSVWSLISFTEKSVKLTDAQSCTTTNGNAQIVVADSSQLVAGMKVSGTGIQANSVISTIDDATHVTLDKTANASGTNTITFKCPADTGYDVYGKNVGGALKLFLKKRSSILTKNTNTTQDGVEVLSGDTTMRWLGAVITSGTDGQADWTLSGQRRFRVFNAYNKRFLQNCEFFKNSGTYYKAMGTTFARLEIWGASGGGARSTNAGAGGTTSIGSLLSVTGGGGGRTDHAAAPGSATGADVSVQGTGDLTGATNYVTPRCEGANGSPGGGIGLDGSGAGGTWALKWVAAPSLGATETITCGAAGARTGVDSEDGGAGRAALYETVSY